MGEFDPRFDPAYQPGFDPSKHTPAAMPAPDNADVGVAPAEAPAETITIAPAAPVAPNPAPGAPRRNPLLVILWTLSALFVASGFYGFRLIGDRVTALGSTGGFGGADYYLLQSYVILAPLLIVLGLATAVGTLFLLAARWKRSARTS
jgi:hypothetical protein